MVLQLTTELAVREAAIDGTLLTTPEQVHAYLEDMTPLANEIFVILTLNAKNKVIRKHLISIGTVSSSLVHPREVFRTAIQDNASSIILAHNHPSGDSTPSAEDIKITRQLISAGEVMGIKVLDPYHHWRNGPLPPGGGTLFVPIGFAPPSAGRHEEAGRPSPIPGDGLLHLTLKGGLSWALIQKLMK